MRNRPAIRVMHHLFCRPTLPTLGSLSLFTRRVPSVLVRSQPLFATSVIPSAHFAVDKIETIGPTYLNFERKYPLSRWLSPELSVQYRQSPPGNTAQTAIEQVEYPTNECHGH